MRQPSQFYDDGSDNFAFDQPRLSATRCVLHVFVGVLVFGSFLMRLRQRVCKAEAAKLFVKGGALSHDHNTLGGPKRQSNRDSDDSDMDMPVPGGAVVRQIPVVEKPSKEQPVV